ncbi:hypothetical protein BDF14DRAFT_1836291 [Spinellus fusiger]|nr:hypothetical protein BDF14DRAFT_1836291 [Spinellus fusiger]
MTPHQQQQQQRNGTSPSPKRPISYSSSHHRNLPSLSSSVSSGSSVSFTFPSPVTPKSTPCPYYHYSAASTPPVRQHPQLQQHPLPLSSPRVVESQWPGYSAPTRLRREQSPLSQKYVSTESIRTQWNEEPKKDHSRKEPQKRIHTRRNSNASARRVSFNDHVTVFSPEPIVATPHPLSQHQHQHQHQRHASKQSLSAESLSSSTTEVSDSERYQAILRQCSARSPNQIGWDESQLAVDLAEDDVLHESKASQSIRKLKQLKINPFNSNASSHSSFSKNKVLRTLKKLKQLFF